MIKVKILVLFLFVQSIFSSEHEVGLLLGLARPTDFTRMSRVDLCALNRKRFPNTLIDSIQAGPCKLCCERYVCPSRLIAHYNKVHFPIDLGCVILHCEICARGGVGSFFSAQSTYYTHKSSCHPLRDL